MKAPHFSCRFVLLLVPLLAATAGGGSVELVKMHYDHSRQPGVLLSDGRVFIPDNDSEIYDPQTDSFKALHIIGYCGAADLAATLLPDGAVFAVGASVVEIFDPVSGSYFSPGHLGCPNRDGATVTLLPNGRVLIAGGCTDLRAELYDPVSHTISFTGKMGSYRSDLVATLLADGNVLFTGGRTYEGRGLATSEEYDFRSGAFVPTQPMKAKRYNHAGTLLADGRVLVTGKLADEKGPSAELYDPKSGKFAATGEMIYGRMGHTASLLVNGDVLVTGGFGWRLGNLFGSGLVEEQNSVEVYRTATGRFSGLAPMRMRRRQHSATNLLDGRLLVAGGVNYGRWYEIEDHPAEYQDTAELYVSETPGSERIVRPLFAWRLDFRSGPRWVLVSGSGFLPGDTVLIDGEAQRTAYISNGLLGVSFSEERSAENPGMNEVRVRYTFAGQPSVTRAVRLQALDSVK